VFALLILNVIWYQFPVPGEVRYFVHTTRTPFHSNLDEIPPPCQYIDRPLPLLLKYPMQVVATLFNFVNMAVTCSVLVVEMRVRKKEISRGMSQLDSKRAFVR
jgi:hypothetical protein